MAQYLKPLPTITPLNQPYWDGLKHRELQAAAMRRMPQGLVSALAVLPAMLVAQVHLDHAQRTRPRQFLGGVPSVIFQGVRGEIPYNVAEVELDEGPRLMTNLVGVANDDNQGRDAG